VLKPDCWNPGYLMPDEHSYANCKRRTAPSGRDPEARAEPSRNAQLQNGRSGYALTDVASLPAGSK
jgi:hypothetical protein